MFFFLFDNIYIPVISVRVTKPRIPATVRENYERVEAEKTRLMIAKQTQTVVEREAETERKRATIEAMKKAEVSKIEMQQRVDEEEANQRIGAIRDKMNLERVKAQTDAEFCKSETEINKIFLILF